MKIILLGAPGAGKGTVAKLLKKLDGSVQISTGDILRAAVAEGSALGKRAEAAMKAGDLVSDALIMGIMKERLQQEDCKNGYLLDGFPRTVNQAIALTSMLKTMGESLDLVVSIEVPKDVIIDRLTTRRTCSDCGEIYNVKSNPPEKAGICNRCNGPVVQRDDETEEAINNRLDVYQEKTAPLANYYKEQGLLMTVSTTDSHEVIEAIKQVLAEHA